MILPIYITGHPTLHSPAEPVTEFNDDLAKLVENMYETTVAAPGVGLAAPQIGIGKQIFVWVYANQTVAPARGVAINPQLFIEPIQPGGTTEEDAEGCLSFPGVKYQLRRSPRALFRAQGLDGKPYELEADGWFARILQHEYDHLQGTLYVDRLAEPFSADAASFYQDNKWGSENATWTAGEPR